MASTGSKIYKAARWLILLALLVVVGLMLKRPAPAAAPLSAADVPAQSQIFQEKLSNLNAASEHGDANYQEAFTAGEVNSFIADSSVRATQQASAPQATQKPANTDDAPDLSTPLDAGELQAALDKTQIAFEGDEVVAQTMVQRYGRDIYVTVRGKIGVQGGYMTFVPTAFKIGSLSVPVSLVNDRLQEKLAEPDTHEKLRMPAFIADLRVENGELKIKEK